MTVETIKDDLFEFFRMSTSLLEVDFNGSKDAIERVKEMILNDRYIPLLTPDKLGYSANLNAKLPELTDRAEKILKELGFNLDLPKSYKLAIIMGLSLIEALRRLYLGNIPNPKEKIYLDKSSKFSIYIYIIDLLNLYRFILVTKSGGEGIDPVKAFSRIFGNEDKGRTTDDDIDNKLLQEEIEKKLLLILM